MMNAAAYVRQRCSFKLTDVLCPDLRDLLRQITADLEVSGEVVFLSDQGEEPDRFAIVSVEGVLSPLIVPAECLQVSREGIPEKPVATDEMCRR
jgi:hypothetical protein